MSKNNGPLVLAEAELMAALRCCATEPSAGGGCRNCPMDGKVGRLECSELVCLMAADRIGELQEEINRLKASLETVSQWRQSEMVRMAKEMNTALDRGLIGASKEHMSALLGHQKELAALGVESMIHAEPAGEGWQCIRLEIGGTCVFGGRDGTDG